MNAVKSQSDNEVLSSRSLDKILTKKKKKYHILWQTHRAKLPSSRTVHFKTRGENDQRQKADISGILTEIRSELPFKKKNVLLDLRFSFYLF